MVVLDYIIRNTGIFRFFLNLNFLLDRGNDNWLIRYTPSQTIEHKDLKGNNKVKSISDLKQKELQDLTIVTTKGI